LLEVEGVEEVDDGAVIGQQGVLALGGAAAQLLGALALEGGDFVFGAPGGGFDRREVPCPAGADVESVDGIKITLPEVGRRAGGAFAALPGFVSRSRDS